ncbi:MAG: hypothetical protein MJB14_13195, partial [Spirochaetes bacterium]|nr:hypothetical protein [Spirochaetota bacterium]
DLASDNTKYGGLNSLVKLEKIYVDMIKYEEPGSEGYEEIEEKIIKTILLLGDHYNTLTIMDQKWHLTAAEWLLEILRKGVSREEYYQFCKKIMERTASEGYADMVMIHRTLEMYREGKKEEALAILTSFKPKHNFKRSLRINDWLSESKLIPDSMVYQYNYSKKNQK